ncbi:DUF5677 domain-containing protein [Halomonas sp. GXIMD04776]|uniref:DUF5677 domain-containing protein n=1 Tax=Halomonas sp. GXIMD04776 TaxID=3415605 RepID=UPI003C883C99
MLIELKKRVVLVNLLSSTSDYLELMKSSLDFHISVLALCTRSIYEINIRIRSLIEHQDEMAKWQSEAVTDKVQTLEGILSLANESENIKEQYTLKSEIERLNNLVEKYGFPTVKQPASTGNLANKVGQEKEHKALFKLYSKLIHPSSYLVNDYGSASSLENQKILQIHAQLYAHDTVSRVCEELSVPNDVSKPYGQA